MKVTVQAPGTIILAGEMAVNELQYRGLALAVDRYVYCDFEHLENFSISLPDLGISKVTASYEGGVFSLLEGFSVDESLEKKQRDQAQLARATLETVLLFLESQGHRIEPFSLATDTIEHNITLKDGSQQKLGLATSAALTVSIIGTLLKVYAYDIYENDTKWIIYKLAILSHFRGHIPIRSGLDVASCTFGKIIDYQRYDRQWVQSQLDNNVSLAQIVEMNWPNVSIDDFDIPAEIQFTAAWCGSKLNPHMVREKVRQFRDQDPQTFEQFVNMIGEATLKTKQAVVDNHHSYLINLVEASNLLFHNMAEAFGLDINSQKHKECHQIAKKHEGASKPCGLFHGDISVAVCFDQFIKEDIEWEWEEAGLYPLDVFVASKGVSVWY